MVPNAITPPPNEAFSLWICDPSDAGIEVAVPPTSLRRERRAGITDVPALYRGRILLRAAAGYAPATGSRPSGNCLTGKKWQCVPMRIRIGRIWVMRPFCACIRA